MKRFSPKQTLSNIKTAVRETVDFVIMKNGVRASFSFAATFLLAASTFAQTNPTGIVQENELQTLIKNRDAMCAVNKDSEDCKAAREAVNYRMNPRLGEQQQRCEKMSEKIEETARKVSKACSGAGLGGGVERCMTIAAKCDDAEQDLFDITEEDEGKEYCNTMLANRCSGLSFFNDGRDYRTERREAEKDRVAAKKELDQALKEQMKDQKDNAKRMQQLAVKEQTLAYNNREEERELTKKFSEAMEGVSKATREAFEKAQDEADKMDAAYVNMRKDRNLAVDAVIEAEDALQLVCRTAAQKKYETLEAERKAKLNDKKKNRGTAVSGAKNRDKAAANRQKAIDFMSYFNECVQGVTPEGVGAINNINRQKRAKETQEKFLADQTVMIEAQRKRMMQKLDSMQSEATNAQSKAYKDAQEALTAMRERHRLAAQQLANEKSQASQEQMMDMTNGTTALTNANTELMRTQKEAAVASSREKCLGRVAQRSETSRDRLNENFGETTPNFQGLQALCRQRDRLKSSGVACPTDGVDSCEILNRLEKGVTASGKKIKPVHLDTSNQSVGQ